MSLFGGRRIAAAIVGGLVIFAIGGGYALAAGGGTINACVHKGTRALYHAPCHKGDKNISWNQVGPQGPAGATGAQGPQGPQGSKGLQGPAGPFPTTLPSGDTITGSYAIVGGAVSGSGSDWGVSAISFPYPLASAPQVKVVLAGGPSQTGCSGSVDHPTAASGMLCVYESAHSGVSTGYPDVCAPTGCSAGSIASTTGAVVRAFATSNTVRWYDWGTWAATG